MPAAHKSLACGAGLLDSMHDACGSHMISSLKSVFYLFCIGPLAHDDMRMDLATKT